jgi:hypothetical protein
LSESSSRGRRTAAANESPPRGRLGGAGADTTWQGHRGLMQRGVANQAGGRLLARISNQDPSTVTNEPVVNACPSRLVAGRWTPSAQVSVSRSSDCWGRCRRPRRHGGTVAWVSRGLRLGLRDRRAKDAKWPCRRRRRAPGRHRCPMPRAARHPVPGHRPGHRSRSCDRSPAGSARLPPDGRQPGCLHLHRVRRQPGGADHRSGMSPVGRR